MKTFSWRIAVSLGLLALSSATGAAQGVTFDGHRYIPISASDISDARAQASVWGGHLVTINDPAEQAFLLQTFVQPSGQETYIGLSDEVTEDEFVWDSGEALSFESWAVGEPNDFGSGEDYATLRPDGNWNDDAGTVARPAIVELPAGWRPSRGPVVFGGHTYVLVDASGVTDARARAAALGGYLAAINDAAENDFLTQAFAFPTGFAPYIGLSDQQTEGTFVWDSGEPLAFTSWAPGEPNNGLGLEDYVRLGADGKWSDDWGQQGGQAIVEVPTVNRPDLPSPAAAGTHNGHEYRVFYPMRLDQARTLASLYGGYVVAINDQAENDFVKQTFVDPFFAVEPFIGLSDELVEGTFVWDSQEPLSFTNWAAGEPNNLGEEDYVNMRFDGQWNDANGHDLRPPVLELPNVGATDLGVTAITTPGCATPGTTSLQLTVTCFAQTVPSGSTLAIDYSLDGGPTTTTMLTLGADLELGDKVSHTVSIPTSSPMTVVFARTPAGDANPLNDAVLATIFTGAIPVSAVAPYFEDFERGPGGWRTEGWVVNAPASVWELGTATTPSLGPWSGANAWVTTLNGNYAHSSVGSVISPAFDCSGLTQDPILSFRLRTAMHCCVDAVGVEVDLDDGNGFVALGSASDPNWYDGTYTVVGDGFIGATPYRLVSHAIDGAAGRPCVRVRFVFGSSTAFSDEGAVFDDVTIKGTVGAGTQLLSGDDIDQSITVGTTPQFADAIELAANSLVTLETMTPGGTFTGSLLFVFLQPVTTGSPLTSLRPGIWLDPGSVIVAAGGPTGPFGLPLVLPAGGDSISFPYPGGLSGFSIISQSVVFSPAADNGIYASTDGTELILQ